MLQKILKSFSLKKVSSYYQKMEIATEFHNNFSKVLEFLKRILWPISCIDMVPHMVPHSGKKKKL